MEEPLSPELSPASEIPQFSRAEFGPKPEQCQLCNAVLDREYYRVHQSQACERCAQTVATAQPPDSHASFLRGLLFGAGGAFLGFVAYAGFSIVTGWQIGYLALVVGWLVAKAMRKGSRNLGGRRYQIAAVALTYVAIALAAVPIGIASVWHDEDASQHAAASANPGQPAAPASSQRTPAPAAGEAATSADASHDGATDAASVDAGNRDLKKSSFSGSTLALLAVELFGVGLISPFLALESPASGALGLIILWVGLSFAWRGMASRRVAVEGPFEFAPRESV